MSIKTVGVLAGALWGVSLCQGANASAGGAPAKGSGSILGLVSNMSGAPQMGATVFLYNRYDQLVQRSLTTDKGAFGFDDLLPDVYAIRVSLSSFLPVLKRNIVVQPGMQSLLNVNLASVFSSIQLVAVTPGDGSLMSDEWKWVLRSAAATRPVLRFGPDIAAPPAHKESPGVFSSTRGLVQVSAGDANSAVNASPDLGTAFALATSVFGNNQVQVSGNFGYSSYSGNPTTAFRTSYRRQLAGGEAPEVQVTMRQTALPSRPGAAMLAGMQDGAPMLRTLSASLADQTDLTDRIRFEYGFTMDSVTFVDRLNYFSPYGRLTYDRGDGEVIQLSYLSGAPPAALLNQTGESGAPLQQDLSALGVFPRLSVREGRARMQRSQSWEAGYRRCFGSRTFSVAVYSESLSNTAIAVSGAPEFEASPEFLPDFFSETSVFNAGNLNTIGYLATVSQKVGDSFEASVSAGNAGALTARESALETGSPDELRALIRESRRYSVTGRFSGHIARTGTQFSTSYQWADLAALTPPHVFLTQMAREGTGWNLQVRQPIPYLGTLPGRLEANIDVRNLLAQGYVPLTAAGRRVSLMNTPRSLRGGLSFSF